MGLYAINFVATRPVVLRLERKTRATIMAAVTSMVAVTVITIFGTTTNTQVSIYLFSYILLCLINTFLHEQEVTAALNPTCITSWLFL